MSVVREEIMIVFGVDQTQIDNVLRTMPVKFQAAGKRMNDSLESQFKSFGRNIGGSFAASFVGGFAGAAIGGKIAQIVQSVFAKPFELVREQQEKAMGVNRSVLRTDLDPQRLQQGQNAFRSARLGEGRFEQALEQTGNAVATAGETGETGAKMANALIELGASLDTIRSGDYKAVFFQIAANMQSAALSAEKIAALRDVFGRGGPELTLAFRKGLGGIEANSGILDDQSLNDAKHRERMSEESAFAFSDLKKSWPMRAVRGGGELLRMASLGLGSLLAGGSIIPWNTGDRSGDERFLAEQKAEKEKEKLKALQEQAKLEKQQKEDAKRDAELDKEADRLNESTADRNHRMAQKQLTLEQQIAEAKKLQAAFDSEAAAIMNKKLETITALDRKNAAAAAADAKKFQEEAEAKQKELDEKKKEFQEQADDAQRRLEKAETDRARTEAERYGMSVGDLTARGIDGFDPAEGVRGHSGRRRARRAFSRWAGNLSAAERYDVEAAREIEAAREYAKFAAAYGQFEEAEMARYYADQVTSTLNFAKPSEAEWFRSAEEAIVESKRTLQALLDKAEGEGIHIKPRMGP